MQPSLQDLIRDRQQGAFIGREVQAIQYRENLALPVTDGHRRFLFNIYGDAGVGKTYLTKQLRQNASNSGALTAYTDETADDVLSVMAAIAEDFSRAGVRFGEFEKRVAAYRQRRYELESDPNAPDGVATFLTKTMAKVALAAARDIPIAGNLLAPVDPVALAEQADRARAYLARKLGDHADVRLLLSPAEELTPIFVSGLKRVPTNRQIALFFDTYERTAAVLDRWLLDLYSGKYGDLPATLITTISGQYPLNPNLWSDYLSVVADVPLETFTEAEARQFLGSKNITDESTIEVILNLSGRLPMWLATLADARPGDAADVGDPTGDAVGRFLKWEQDPVRRTLAVTAALPRTFNQDILNAIVPAEDTPELFSWLSGLPFVSKQINYWKYHEVVRAAMIRLQRVQSPRDWSLNHLNLARTHEQWAVDAVADTHETWANANWISHTREQTYHLLCANPVKNAPQALSLAVKASGSDIVNARQWAQIFADAGRDTDNFMLRNWGDCLREGIRGNDLIEYLTCIIDHPQVDPAALAAAYLERGRNYRLTERYEAALADYSRAIDLGPENARALTGRGDTYRAMKRYEAALADYSRAIDLGPGNIRHLLIRGITYWTIGRYAEALADQDRAIDLDPGSTVPLSSRALTYWAMKRYEEALADYGRAIDLDPEDATIFRVRGFIYNSMKRYEEALADFSRAIVLDPEGTEALSGRGDTYRAMKRYEEALADYGRAIDLAAPGNTRFLTSRGLTYSIMGRDQEALGDLERAIDLDPNDTLALISRGLTYQTMERYEEALADYSRAIDLAAPGDTRALISRGDTYQVMERYEEALADYSRAIDLDPEETRALISRGDTYRVMERYEEAFVDYSRAIDLDPENAGALSGRGETYIMKEFYNEGVADLRRAAEFDPDVNDNLAGDFISLAANYLRTGQLQAAAAIFEAVVSVSPASADGHNNLAFCLLPVNPVSALNELDKAENLRPNYLTTLANRVLALHLLARDEEALALGTSQEDNASLEGLMWTITENHTLQLSGWINVYEYLCSLLNHIRSECA